MLIFDNILFASFIPQILMIIGVISCFSAQLFASVPEIEPEQTPEFQVCSYKSEDKQPQKVFDFYDYPNLQIEGILSKTSDKLFVETTPAYKYPVLTFLFRKLETGYSSFSRPPPAA